MIALTTQLMGNAEIAIRSGALVCGLVATLLTFSMSRDKGIGLLWWFGVPSLTWLTWTATSDAPLLAAWALAFFGAAKGGRWWLLAGLGAGLAMLSKYTGMAAMPLLLLGAGQQDWRSRWPYLGAAIAFLVVSPNLLWNARHDWVSFRFQFTEGLASTVEPGVVGFGTLILDQTLVLTPLIAVAAFWWLVTSMGRHVKGALSGDESGRIERMAWFTCAPLVIFFSFAATKSPPEAHWLGIAWVGLGVGLSYSTGALRKLVGIGLWIGIMANMALGLHAVRPFLPFDIAGQRFTEGPVIANGVASWVFPEGVAWLPENGDKAAVLYTERYQEASLVHYYLGIRAYKHPACGREDQYNIWAVPDAEQAMFLRPATRVYDALCTDLRYSRTGPFRYDVVDGFGRTGRRMQVFVLEAKE
jgi:4-amino-4-deoxy-L-arabinose transferase-like glycosyltransferase